MSMRVASLPRFLQNAPSLRVTASALLLAVLLLVLLVFGADAVDAASIPGPDPFRWT